MISVMAADFWNAICKILAKKTYYSSCFEKFKNNIKETWKTIKDILNKDNQNKTESKYFIVNDNHISNPIIMPMNLTNTLQILDLT